MKSNADPARMLVVNADDFGLSEAVNAGIVEAHRRGILTSTTLLANAPAFRDAVRLAGENPRLGIGLHLNLVRGAPLSKTGEVPLLVDAKGEMRRFRIRNASGEFLAQAEREYRAQFEKIIGAGIAPSHIDFEKHHAWQGPLYRLACRLAREYGVAGVRNLAEPVWGALRRMGWPGAGNAGMAMLLRAGFALGGGGRKTGLATPDWFWGQLHIGGMVEEAWLKLLDALPAGVSEVMTHPGFADDGGGMGASWIAEKRTAELSALVSPAVREAVGRNNIVLISYRDMRGYQ